MNWSIRKGGGGELVYFGATILQWCLGGRFWRYKTPSNINEPSYWVVKRQKFYKQMVGKPSSLDGTV